MTREVAWFVYQSLNGSTHFCAYRIYSDNAEPRDSRPPEIRSARKKTLAARFVRV